jgi:hypothetical protein
MASAICEHSHFADAIMDRMTAKSHRLELVGESRRKKKQVE